MTAGAFSNGPYERSGVVVFSALHVLVGSYTGRVTGPATTNGVCATAASKRKSFRRMYAPVSIIAYDVDCRTTWSSRLHTMYMGHFGRSGRLPGQQVFS